jgi:hypothetical protein
MYLRKVIFCGGYTQYKRPGQAHQRTDYYKPAGQGATRCHTESGSKKKDFYKEI